MKNVLIKSFVFAIVFILAGCSNEEQIKAVYDSENQELVLHKNDYYTVYAIDDITSLQKEIDAWNKQFYLKTKGGTEDNFQLEEIVKSSEFDNCDVVLAKSENECAAYYRQNGIFVRKLYITIEQGEENAYVIKYKDADTNATAHVQISKEGKVVPNQLTKVSGQDVMDCLTDAYSNHGWASVWLTVQSALIWETAAVVAIACTVHNA